MTPAPRQAEVGHRLANRLIAISISEAADVARLGFPDDQMDRVLEAVLAPLVSEGARIAYGGRIEHPHNFTLVISHKLAEAYRRFDVEPGQRPFVHFVAHHRLLRTGPDIFLAHLQLLDRYGEVWLVDRAKALYRAACLNPGAGAKFALQPIGGADDTGEPEYFRDAAGLTATSTYRKLQASTPDSDAESFTEMREAMAACSDARVLVGGRKAGFTGAMSGLCEEALLTIRSGRRLLVLGGFGGAARDIAIALGLLPVSAQVPPEATPEVQADADRYRNGLDQLAAARPAFESVAGAHLALLPALAQIDSLPDASEGVLRYLFRVLSPG